MLMTVDCSDANRVKTLRRKNQLRLCLIDGYKSTVDTGQERPDIFISKFYRAVNVVNV